MSRVFTTSADHLDIATAPITVPPYSVSAWFKLNNTNPASDHQIAVMGTSASNNNRYTMTLYIPTGTVASEERDTITSNSTATANVLETTFWHMATSVFATDSSRAAYLDGASKGTNTTARAPTAPNRFRVGAQLSGTASMVGYIAHVAIWNVALSDAEVLTLFTQLPTAVQRANLIDYWPLVDGQSPELPLVGADNLIVTGTTFSTDNPVIGLPPGSVGPSFFYIMP